MVQSILLKKKAEDFGIDLNKSPDRGLVLVCRYMLNGIFPSLQQDPRRITRGYMDILEEDLREIRNEFELLSVKERRKLMSLQFVKSVSAIIKLTEEAHKAITTATVMLDTGINKANYNSYIDSINECRRAIGNALQYFLI